MQRAAILFSAFLGLSVGPSAALTAPHAVVDLAERQDWAAVAELLQADTDPRAIQPDGMTALHWAAHWGHVESVRLLLEAGCDPNANTKYKVPPLALACNNGHTEVIGLLLESGADENAALPGGETMLMRAARTGRLESVQRLIVHGADVNAVEGRGQTALMWAAAEGNSEVVSQLVESGANIKAKVDSGFTAIMFAAREGRLATARLLLDLGADVNTAMNPKNTAGRAPRRGMSALMLAVESGHFELAMMLIGKGADPNDQRSGYTPLHALSWVRKANRGDNIHGDPEPRGSGALTSLEFVRRIVASGANVNARLWSGQSRRAELNKRLATPFLLASNTADLPLMKLLVELGADPTIPNADGCTPLIAAAGVGVVAVGEEAGTEPEVIEAIKFLMHCGADINARDQNGQSVMHGAAYRNYPLAVDLLAQLGADPNIWNQKNKYGSTPVMIAQGRRPGSFKPSPETVSALRRAMASQTSR